MIAEPFCWEQAFLKAQAGDDQAALALALELIERDPGPEVFEIAASISCRHGNVDNAADLYAHGLSRYPGNLVLVVNCARLLRDHLGQADKALEILNSFLETRPDVPSVSHTRIETLRTQSRLMEAERAARAHVSRFPIHGGGHLALALTLFDQRRMVEALLACDDATVFPESAARAHELAANAYVALGDARGALDRYGRALKLAPDPDLHSRLLMSMMYCDDVPVSRIQQEAQRWVNMHMAGIASTTRWPHLNFAPDRGLKIGVLSGDFRQCSTPHLAFPLWAHRPTRWEVILYDNAPATDDWSERFRETSAGWRDISALSDDESAELIIADEIDVLIDLNGHTLGGRPGVFHRKPAPIQMAWLDFVGTTGLQTYDAIIGDEHHLPLTDQVFYTEPIRHVRDNLYRYCVPENPPEVSPLPAGNSGQITFGCFNSAYKITPSVLDCWAQILASLPNSSLLLNSLDFALPDTCDRFLSVFEDSGIDRARIIFRPGASTPQDLMADYAKIDIALDPFPYSGGLTTIEGLFMGVPVVTMPGDRFGSRHSTAHLRTLGLHDWIADTVEAYVALAVTKASRLTELAALRRALRDCLRASKLCDGTGLAQDLDAIVSALWAQACRAKTDHEQETT